MNDRSALADADPAPTPQSLAQVSIQAEQYQADLELLDRDRRRGDDLLPRAPELIPEDIAR